ncbi:MAG: hypothetical protein JNM39_14485 [Bdellovibrionaceae bacterium]|nr:hypothetical protein [Pseudobdellovibrionaceae bacterium]
MNRNNEVVNKRKLVISFAATILASLITSNAIAQSSTTSSATATVAAPAAGTSTVAAPATASPLGRFGLTYTADTSFGPTDNMKAVVTNIAGVNYKLSKNEKIAFKQYWDQAVGPKATPEDNKMSWAVMQYSTKTKGILGSDEIAPLFWYYIPTAQNRDLENGLPNGRLDSNGGFRADIEVPWTLTPKWTVSYYFNPRQSLMPGKQVVYEKDEESGKFVGKKLAQTTTTLLHYGFAYYNVNDVVQPYAALGFRHDFLTLDGFANTRNFALPVVGCNFTFNKNVVLSAEINQDSPNLGVPLTSTKYIETSPGQFDRITQSESNAWLDSHNFNYEVILAISI